MAAAQGNQTAILQTIGPDMCLTLDHLAAALPMVSRKMLVMAVCRLVEVGYVERVERGCYRLTEKGQQAQAAGKVIKSGSRAPRPRMKISRKCLTSRLWAAMRIRRKFTIGDLLVDAVDDEKTGRDLAGRYLRGLEKTGYVVRLRTKEPGTSLTSNGFIRWSLIQDSGPQAPVLRRNGVVYDPNTQEEVTPCLNG